MIKSTTRRHQMKSKKRDGRVNIVQVRLTAEDKRRFEVAAQAVGLTTSGWVRMICLQEARSLPARTER